MHRHSGGRVVREELGEEFVQLRERVLVCNQDGRVDDEIGPTPARAQYRFEVRERLLRLLRERWAGCLACRRDAVINSGMEDGMQEAMDLLEQIAMSRRPHH